jgi:hypothetical protein
VIRGPNNKKYSAKSEMFKFLRNEFGPQRLVTQDSLFSQYIGTGINPVVPAFPIARAFLSLWLSGHSSFPVDPAVLSFWLSSDRSGY